MGKINSTIIDYLENSEKTTKGRKLREQHLQKEVFKICLWIAITIVIIILAIIFQSLFATIASALTIIFAIRDAYKVYMKYKRKNK